MRRLALAGLLIALPLIGGGCSTPQQKIVTVLGPERILQVPAKIDPAQKHCMDVDLPSVDLIPLGMPPEKVAAVLGVLMNRYKLGYDDCKARLLAVGGDVVTP